MPIPFILGAAAVAAAGYGVKKGLDAKEDMDTASEYNNRAKVIAKKTEDAIKNQKDHTTCQIESLGKTKINIFGTSMTDFVKHFEKIKNIEIGDSEGLDELRDFNPSSPEFKELKKLSLEASDMVAAGLGSVAGGTLLAAGTYGSVMFGGFAIASTGAGIAGLSGAAATNATLAWLGGGAVGSGMTAFGMTGGMVVLGGLVVGPALAIGGAFLASKAEDAKYQAYSNFDKAEEYKEQGKGIIVTLNAMERRAEQIEKALIALNSRLEKSVHELIATIDRVGVDYKMFDALAKKSVMQSMCYAKAVKTVLDTSLLHEDGSLNDEGVVNAIQGAKVLVNKAK